uniref:G-patch domain-containing protein n=1 Tax=Strongyloides papillosus TaxID=174720 RepID=A0A0N5C300_STREA
MYRKFLGHNPLEMSSSLCASAQSRADKMANQNRLFTDNEQEYDEYVFSSEQGHGMQQKKRKDFGRILSHELKTIGIGIAKSGLGTYACIKFSTNWKRSSTIQIPRGQE